MDTVVEKKQLEQDFSRRQFRVKPTHAVNKSKGLCLSMAGYRFDRSKVGINIQRN